MEEYCEFDIDSLFEEAKKRKRTKESMIEVLESTSPEGENPLNF
jgi:hypothetical protein